MRGPTTTGVEKCAPASRLVTTSCRANRPWPLSGLVSPYDTAMTLLYAETSALTPSTSPLSRLIRRSSDQLTPSLDVASSSRLGSIPLQVAYMRPLTGSAVADGRQHRMPGGPALRSRVMTPPSVH